MTLSLFRIVSNHAEHQHKSPCPVLLLYAHPSRHSTRLMQHSEYSTKQNSGNLFMLEFPCRGEQPFFLTKNRYSVKLDFMHIVIARRPKADVAISYPSQHRGCYNTKTTHDDAHSFDLDEVLSDLDVIFLSGSARYMLYLDCKARFSPVSSPPALYCPPDSPIRLPLEPSPPLRKICPPPHTP